MRRDSKDPEWIKCKSAVDKRDKRQCQFERCLSAKEYHQLRRGSPSSLDRAHILSAASRPDKIYNPNNVITLKRYIHRRMDDWQCPLTGEPADANTHFWWWKRIKTHSMEAYDPYIDYELELLGII